MAFLSGPGSLVKGFVTLSGLSGASVSGYYAYSSATNTNTSIVKGNSSNPLPKNSQTQEPKIEVKDLSIGSTFTLSKKIKCIGDAEVKITWSSIENTGLTDSMIDSDPTKEGTPVGCTNMTLHKGKNGDSTKWKFESETVVKDDKIGIVVWLEANNMKKKNLRHQIYFLEKKSDKWEVKFGFVTNKHLDSLKEIKSPDESTIKETFSDVSQDETKIPTEWDTKTYSGTWKEETGKHKKLLLDGMFYEKGKFKDVMEYVYKDGKLYKYESGSPDFKAKLKKWFEPFKGKKGIWEEKSNSN